ncbi:glycosyltransferase family A protein [Holdemania massiliensis]|uniref:glycosyltransferase family A protein n=1 Tax=Holdemania massiliensis TaxID=1468449 RepID=UPI0035677608
MKEANFGIVVAAYNRPKPLEKLLESLNLIKCDIRIPLVISIDNKGTNEVNKIAQDFQWKYGEKKVIIHPRKLGLRAHFIWAGDQTEKFGNVLFLEDDLYVSPYVMDFVATVIDKYENDERISAASLYNPVLCEFDKTKFYQYQDGYDNYFFQHPYWGNVWFGDSWEEFKKWLETYEYAPEILPKNVQCWRETSFKKLYIQYLAELDRYVVYPRTSYVTNMGETGLHSKFDYNQFQTVFQQGQTVFNYSSFDESNCIYDVFFEMIPRIVKKLNPELCEFDFVLDTRGLRKHYKTEHTLTVRKTTAAIKSFNRRFRPTEVNAILNCEGEGLSLTTVSDVIYEDDFEQRYIVNDVLCNNYNLGLREVWACFLYILKKKLRKEI